MFYPFSLKKSFFIAALLGAFSTAHAQYLKVSCGGQFVTAIKADSTLVSWGYNANGQLGTGNYTNYKTPQAAAVGSKWIDVSAGVSHEILLAADSTLWACGRRAVWTSDTTIRRNDSLPVQISTDHWKYINASLNTTAAIKSDGTLWMGGLNSNGELGSGDTLVYPGLRQVGSDTNWSMVSSGAYHVLAVKTDGTLWAWGYNYFGQLGGNTVEAHVPVQVGQDTNWAQVAAGGLHSMAIKKDGTLYSWGFNLYQQLGRATTGNSDSVVTKVGTDHWLQISASELSSYAIRTDHSAWAWGSNLIGQLGLPTNNVPANAVSIYNTPTQIATDTNWLIISGAASWGEPLTYSANAAAMRTDKINICVTGDNSKGQLGDSSTVAFSDNFLCGQIPTATKEIAWEKTNINLYPNPAADVLYVDVPYSNQCLTISVYSVDGKMQLSGTVKQVEKTSLNIQNLTPGIYFVRISGSNISFNGKFVKE